MVYVTSEDSTDQLGHQLAMQLRGAHAHLRRRSNLAFAPFGMSTDQYVLLRVLAEQGEATQQELVRLCYSDTATIGTMLSLLEAKRLISRKRHPRDKRAVNVRLSRSGGRLARKMRIASSGVRADLTALFNQDELQSLSEFLGRLARAWRPTRRRTGAGGSPGRIRRAFRISLNSITNQKQNQQ